MHSIKEGSGASEKEEGGAESSRPSSLCRAEPQSSSSSSKLSMADQNEEYGAQIWRLIEEDDVFPSQALPIFKKVKKRCLKDSLQENNYNPLRVGKIVLMLGILASKVKRYSLAIRYLEMSVKLYSLVLDLANEYDDLTLHEIQLDEIHIKGRLIIAHDYLGSNFEEMGLLREASNHIAKSFELSKDIPNPALSSVQGNCYYNLSLWALKCLQLDRAVDMGDKSVELFRRLPPDRNENRIQLGKSQRLIALAYLIKGDNRKYEKWMQDYHTTMVPLGSQIWFDILYMEVEIVLWKGLYAQGEDQLEWLLSLDLNVSQKLQTLVWMLILHHHQKDAQKIIEHIDSIKGLLIQENIAIEVKAKAVYEISRVLYMHKSYVGALTLVDNVLAEFDKFSLDVEYDMKGRLFLLKGQILVSSNKDEMDAMICFNQAGGLLKECFPKTHYVIAQLNQSTARAHLQFGHSTMAHQLLKEAREVMTSFSPLSLTFIKLNFDFVDVYVRRNKFRYAKELLEEMVETMETGRITPHEPFCHDSKWQCAELVSEPQDALLKDAKVRLEGLMKAHPYLV